MRIRKSFVTHALIFIGIIGLTMVCTIAMMSTDLFIKTFFGPRYVQINREYYKALSPHEFDLVEALDKLQRKYETTDSKEEKMHLAEAILSLRNTLGDKIPPAKLDAVKRIREEYVKELMQDK